MTTSAVASVLAWAALVAGARAQCVGPAKMGPPLPLLDRESGASLDIDGDVLVVGAPGSQLVDDLHDEGSASVYRLVGGDWQFEIRLIASDPEDDDDFGRSVAVSGDTVLVGAPHKDNLGAETGAAYTYRYVGGQWIFEQKLFVPDPTYWVQFGTRVALQGDLAVISAPGYQQGEVYVYKRQGGTWTEVQEFQWSGLQGDSAFGSSLDLQGDQLAVGAKYDGLAPIYAGHVLIYGWTGSAFQLSAVLLPADIQAGDNFGSSIASSGDWLVVGASGRNIPGAEDSGTAYVYHRTEAGWVLDAMLDSGDPNVIGNFGDSAAFEGDVIALGEPRDRFDPDVMDSGAVWRFDHVGAAWVRQPKLVELDVSELERFGTAVALRGDDVLAGAPFDGTPSLRPGAVFTFHGPPAWSSLGYALGGTLGLPKLSADVAQDAVTTVSLLLQQGTPDASATLVLGLHDIDHPFKGGVLVPSPDVLVGGLVVGPDGTLCLQSMLVDGLPLGLPLYVQVWMVDALGAKGFAASNAIRLAAP